MFSNRVEITLSSILGTKVLNDDPMGYDQSETEIGRSEKTFGIFLKVINNLEFTGAAKRYLENLYALYGVQAKCRLIRKEKHPTTDDWKLHSEGFLDFSTRKIKDNKLMIDFVEGGLREILTSQLKEKFELDRTTDIEGNTITTLERDSLYLKGRDIYLLSKLSTTDNFIAKSGVWRPNTAETRTSYTPFPLHVDANTDPANIQPQFETLGVDERWERSLSNMFFATSDRERGTIKLSAKIGFNVDSIYMKNARDLTYKVVLDRYDADLVLLNRTEIASYFQANGAEINQFKDIPKFEKTFSIANGNEIKTGESFTIGIYTTGTYDANFTSEAFTEIKISQTDINVSWAEDSFYKATTSPCLSVYDSFQRLSEIYTGNLNSFESYLLDGTDNTFLKDSQHNLVFAPGGWLRNLKRKDENEKLIDWPIELSFEDAYKSVHPILPVGYGILIEGNKQKIVVEDLRFFFQRTVVGHLGKIKITERSVASEYCYQSLKFGYEKGGEYEKPLGLDEYNTQTASRTPLTVVDNEYSAIGPSRTDSYGAEDARRMQYEDFPDEDTPYDKDNFLFDVKKTVNNLYTVREPLDDFEELPTGTYAPETGFNYNLTPARNRKRHSWWFNNGIVKLQDKNIQFLNSKGNSELKTKKVGEDYLKENEDVPIPKLDNPLFEPEWIDAEKAFEQPLLDKILDTTLINGRRINNYYGLWEFTNEQNISEYAYIFTVKSKDKFTFKLLKAYGI